MHRAVVVFALVAAAGTFVAGCGSSSKSPARATATSAPLTTVTTVAAPTSAPPATGNELQLTAQDFAFSPATLSPTAPGATLVVSNAGHVEHNLTIDGLGVNQDLAPGSTVRVAVPDKPGTYAFHCEYHPAKMKGTITVP